MVDESLLAYVLSEEEIEQQSDEWKEHKHQYPRHSLRRLPIVEQYGEYCWHDEDAIIYEEYDDDVAHRFLLEVCQFVCLQ